MTLLGLAPGRAASQAAPDTARDSATVERTRMGFRVSGATLRRLFGDDPRLALTLVPGIMVQRVDLGLAGDADVSIRGGAFGEPSIYVDGAAVRRLLFGRPGVLLGPTSVADVSVTTGAVDLRLADARGGAIEYVTRSGGERLAGSFRAATDEAFAGVGFNRFDATIGGPLPGLRGANWIVGGTLLGQREHFAGLGTEDLAAYIPAGVDTVVDGFNVNTFANRRAYDWATDLRLHGKVLVPIGAATTLAVTGLVNEQQERFFPGRFALAPGLYEGARVSTRILIGNWRQQLGGALSLHVNAAISSFGNASGPLDPVFEAKTRDPSLGITLETLRFNGADSIATPLPERIIRNIRVNSGLRVPYLNQTQFQPGQPTRNNPFGMSSFWPLGGMDGLLDFRSERRVQGRAVMEWRSSAPHRVQVGIDAERTDLSRYSSDLLTAVSLDAYRATPSRFGLLVSDVMEQSRVTLEGGIRFDHYSGVGLFPNTPARISSDPSWNTDAAVDDTAYANSVARVFTPGRSHSGLSFRLGAATGAGRRTRMRASYGSRFEQPPLELVLARTNADLTFTNAGDGFGRDVNYGRTTIAEVGIRHALPAGATADLALYRRSRAAYEAKVTRFRDPRDPTDSLVVFATAKAREPVEWGAELALDWRVGWLTTTAAYGLSSTDLGPTTDPVNSERTYSTQVLTAAAVLQPTSGFARGVVAAATLRLTSGIAYSAVNDFRTLVPDLQQLVAGGPREYLPWTKRLDLRVSRTLRSGAGEWSAFAEARNLLGWQNVLSAFRRDGKVTNDVDRLQRLAAEFVNLASEASNAGALNPDSSIAVGSCASWSVAANCEVLRRVEQRFGNGDGVFTTGEQTATLYTFYDTFFGPTTFYGAGRTIRVGVEVRW
jgi:hypothetical protein